LPRLIRLAFIDISTLEDFHMISAGKIASDPYTRKKGVCPVALDN
jgi:hypothetical protein